MVSDRGVVVALASLSPRVTLVGRPSSPCGTRTRTGGGYVFDLHLLVRWKKATSWGSASHLAGDTIPGPLSPNTIGAWPAPWTTRSGLCSRHRHRSQRYRASQGRPLPAAAVQSGTRQTYVRTEGFAARDLSRTSRRAEPGEEATPWLYANAAGLALILQDGSVL